MLRDLFSLFPAYAGVIPQRQSKQMMKMSFPRIRGGDPRILWDSFKHFIFSPHTRG